MKDENCEREIFRKMTDVMTRFLWRERLTNERDGK